MDFLDKIVRNKYSFALIISLLLAIVYANSIGNLYSIDDDFTIFKNQNIEKGFLGIPAIVTQPYTDPDYGTAYGYRPIAAITFAIEHQIWGFNPHLSHLVNLLLYCLSIFTLLFFLHKILPNYNPYFVSIAVLFFAVHPIHTEVVNNLKSRDILLCFMIGISALSMAMDMIENKKWLLLAPISILYLVACLAHPMALLLAGFWLVLTLFKHTEKGIFSKQAIFGLLLVPFWVILFKIVDGYTTHLISQYKADPNFLWENPLYVFNNQAQTIGLALNALLFYFKQLFVPYPLCYYYGYNQIPFETWQNPMPLLSLTIYTTIAIASAALILKRHVLGFILSVYFICIFPFSNLLQIGPGIVAERWAYFASIGSCLLMAYVLVGVIGGNITNCNSNKTRAKVALTLTAIIVLLYSGLVVARNPNWHDNLTLSGHDAPHLPNSAKANAFLAEELMKQYLQQTEPIPAQHAAIENLLLRSLSIDSTYAEVWNNLGVMNFRKRDTITAQTCYEQAIHYKKPYYLAMSNLADIYNKQGNYPKAIELYSNYIKQDSSNLNAYLNLSRFQSAVNNIDQALSTTNKALILFPKQKTIIYDNNAIILYEHQKLKEAQQNWELALQKDPQNQTIIYKLANVSKEMGDMENNQKYENLLEKK